jgi:hypothetical protein
MKKLVLILLLTLASSALAKRGAPVEVKSVTHEGIQYTVPLKLGVIEAKDIKSDKALWKKRIYKISYIKNLEKDVQDVFIKSLKISNDKKMLIIINEDGNTYHLDLKTNEVCHVIMRKKK